MVTLSRSSVIEAIFEAWQATDESWKLSEDEDAISDAGNSAFMHACNLSLADRVAQFLGEGDWSPRDSYTFTEE